MTNYDEIVLAGYDSLVGEYLFEGVEASAEMLGLLVNDPTLVDFAVACLNDLEIGFKQKSEPVEARSVTSIDWEAFKELPEVEQSVLIGESIITGSLLDDLIAHFEFLSPESQRQLILNPDAELSLALMLFLKEAYGLKSELVIQGIAQRLNARMS